MQDASHLLINGQKILVLRRLVQRREFHGVALKLRKSGKDGNECTDESLYLAEDPDLLQKLLNDEVVYC